MLPDDVQTILRLAVATTIENVDEFSFAAQFIAARAQPIGIEIAVSCGTAKLEGQVSSLPGRRILKRVVLRTVRRALGEISELALAQLHVLANIHVPADGKPELIKIVPVSFRGEMGVLARKQENEIIGSPIVASEEILKRQRSGGMILPPFDSTAGNDLHLSHPNIMILPKFLSWKLT
jgi:hypothetical protein